MNKPALWQRIESRLDSSLPRWRERVQGMGQLEAVGKRASGRNWRDDEVFEALVLAVLSANTDWSKVEQVRAELAELFSGFSLEWYAARSADDVADRLVPWFKDQKAGSMSLRSGLTNLIRTAQKLLKYSRAHGAAADRYFTSLLARCGGDPKGAALRLGCSGDDKLPGLGVALAAEALKNLGFDVAKPDRHILRAAGSFGLAHFSRWPHAGDWAAPTASNRLMLATMAAVEEMAAAADERVVLVDNAIWLLCAKSGLHLTNRELAEIARESESMGDRVAHLDTLIQSWIDEDDQGEQRETLEGLVRALDEDRPSSRKLFPAALKGKSW